MIHSIIDSGKSILHLPITIITVKTKYLNGKTLQAKEITSFTSQKIKKLNFLKHTYAQLKRSIVIFLCHLKKTDKKTTTQLYKPLIN